MRRPPILLVAVAALLLPAGVAGAATSVAERHGLDR
jgi:hypothetical protein